MVRSTGNNLDSFDSTMVKDLEGFVLLTYPGEDALKEEAVGCSWSPIFNVAVDSADKSTRQSVTTEHKMMK